jgi:hypothetical protein
VVALERNKYLSLRGISIQGSGEEYIRRSFMICIGHQILFG